MGKISVIFGKNGFGLGKSNIFLLSVGEIDVFYISLINSLGISEIS